MQTDYTKAEFIGTKIIDNQTILLLSYPCGTNTKNIEVSESDLNKQLGELEKRLSDIDSEWGNQDHKMSGSSDTDKYAEIFRQIKAIEIIRGKAHEHRID